MARRFLFLYLLLIAYKSKPISTLLYSYYNIHLDFFEIILYENLVNQSFGRYIIIYGTLRLEKL